jgi:hypothetical protein
MPEASPKHPRNIPYGRADTGGQILSIGRADIGRTDTAGRMRADIQAGDCGRADTGGRKRALGHRADGYGWADTGRRIRVGGCERADIGQADTWDHKGPAQIGSPWDLRNQIKFPPIFASGARF